MQQGDNSAKEKTEDNGMKRLFEIAMRKKGLMFGAIILAIISALASFVPYLSIYNVIREIVNVYPDMNQLNTSAVLNQGVYALLGVLANVGLYFLSLVLSHLAAYGTICDLKKDFMSHLAMVPLGFHIMTGSGRLRKIIDTNINGLEGFIAHDLPNTISAMVAPIVMLVMVFAIDWRLGLMTLIGIIVAFTLQGVFSGGDKTKKLIDDYQNALEDMSGASVEYVRGISVVKAFGQTSNSFKSLSDSIDRYMNAVIPYSLSQENMSASLQTALNSIYLFILPMGIYIGSHTNDYKLFVSKLIFFLIFVPAVSMILMKMLYVLVNAQQSALLIGRMDEVLGEKTLVEADSDRKPNSYDVAFSNVSFSYEENQDALDNVSFTANAGEVTAIVGPSGGGKSTIANLIPRFYDVKDGSIKIGGVDIRDISTKNLLDTVAFVFQDNFLFKMSILDNIRLGRPDASREEVIEAAKAAQCDEFVQKLPKGYDTVFGKDGAHFSGGEIQRVAIARAILQNAPILVLDEATAFADPENEYLIQTALQSLMKDKTVIMIAHRLSTVVNASQIIVVKDGRIVERGNHMEMVNKNGEYKKLWDYYTQSLEWKLDNDMHPKKEKAYA